ncbi:hypothetical protein GE09DRAFT_260990 [Coniochaeta sp. 2T2.1]|nr:hypothetical protein GE09DRAFT_260990 [Coniochaeta sp. 2T2.1]
MGASIRRDRALRSGMCLALLSLASASRTHRSPQIAARHEMTVTQTVTVAPSQNTPSPTITAVSDCHSHGTALFCMAGTAEYQVLVTGTESPAPAYTECHSHGAETYCVSPGGEDVEVLIEADGHEDHAHGSPTEDGAEPVSSATATSQEENCHFHAGVEHCVGGDAELSRSEHSCSRKERDYNIPLRIGLLFAMLATSIIGVMLPLAVDTFMPARFGIVFTVLRQFGTGVIISTAFVHLFTHATLMFTNPCVEVDYEATTAAIVMAGIFLSFTVDYICHRLAKSTAKSTPGTTHNDDLVTVIVLEAGIIFHSLLIGLTLVVAGDAYFITLFIVILFHQMFEGIALGSRIASIGKKSPSLLPSSGDVTPTSDKGQSGTHTCGPDVNAAEVFQSPLSLRNKLLMVLAFSLVTPIGMAIGIGVLHRFNGNDPSTLIALGTLDALSAGILIWVGIVEMWARDWMHNGELVDSSALVTFLGGFGLVAGMVLMSFLGKWA